MADLPWSNMWDTAMPNAVAPTTIAKAMSISSRPYSVATEPRSSAAHRYRNDLTRWALTDHAKRIDLHPSLPVSKMELWLTT
jgi:hypothetical protein